MGMSWVPQFKRQDVAIIEEVDAFSGYCHVKQFQFKFSLFQGGQGQPVRRELIIKPPAIAVLLYDPDQDTVVMVEQFRPGAILEVDSPWLLEIAAGILESNETLEAAALREVKEETGCQITSLIPICSYLTTPGISTEKIFLYCGRVQAPENGEVHGVVEEGEDIKVHVLKTEVVFQLLSDGKIVSSPGVIALQWLKLNHSSLHFPQ